MHRFITRLTLPLALVLAPVCLTGCYNLAPETAVGAPAAFRPLPPPGENTLGELRWGLALSGGGMRAALFSMGAMKGLYDNGWMDSIQIISSVSGGGYTAYWLYTQEHTNPSPLNDFGQNTFRDDAFRVGMCEVELASNFYSYREMARTLFDPDETLVQGYEYALLRTFGPAVHDTAELRRSGALRDTPPPLRMHDLAPDVHAGTLPYFVLNATVADPLPRSGWKDGLYELTPFFRGNEAFGYEPWSPADSLPLRQAVAISGAAYRRGLKQRVPNPHASVSQQTLTLADAGPSENLGAIALVRRRVKNIIVVDAEQDAHYGFGAYENLRARLRNWGYALYIPSIELRPEHRRLATGTHVGVVRSMVPGDTFSANVYYIKLSVPVSLDPMIRDAAAAGSGKAINGAVTDSLKASENPRGEWNCEVLRGWNYGLRDRFVHKVHLYSFGEGSGSYPTVFNPLPTGFPQYTTADQSFYRDQTVAFVGLGYLHAEELVSRLPARGQARRP